jgi:hypothetical protein
VNAENVSTSPSGFQTPHPRAERPLHRALVSACQLNLLLRRTRAESLSRKRIECIDRLLVGTEAIRASLELLGRSEHCAVEIPPAAETGFNVEPEAAVAGALQ